MLSCARAGSATLGKGIKWCMSLLGAPLPLGPSEEGTPGAAPLQAESAAPITGRAEGGRQVSALLAPLSAYA